MLLKATSTWSITLVCEECLVQQTLGATNHRQTHLTAELLVEGQGEEGEGED